MYVCMYVDDVCGLDICVCVLALRGDEISFFLEEREGGGGIGREVVFVYLG